MNTIFALDYAPFLAVNKPELLACYLIIRNFSNSKGKCEVSPALIQEHLRQVPGLVDFNIDNALAELESCGLISQEQEQIKVIAELLCSKTIVSQLKDYAFSDQLPAGYEALFDEKLLYQCYTTNGNVLWKVLAEVSRFLGLDFIVVKRLLENPKIKQRFLELRKKVEEIAEISGQKVTKRKLKKASDKTVSELYEQLMTEVHLKNGEEIPVAEWKCSQILRQYCLCYKERYGQDYIFTASPFGSFEMREAKKILTAFDENATETVQFLKWCFEKKSHEATIKYPLTPRFCSNDNVIREFRQNGTGPVQQVAKVERKSALPTSFIEWIVANYPHIQETYHLSKLEEIVFMKKAYDENDLPHPDMKHVVEYALQIGLLPKTGEVSFG